MDNNNRSESVGRAVRDARSLAGLSQASLAAEMRNQGFNWSQATLWSIEKGHRELRWSEGIALRDLVGFCSDHASSDPQVFRDAATYRRILHLIGGNEEAAKSASDKELFPDIELFDTRGQSLGKATYEAPGLEQA